MPKCQCNFNFFKSPKPPWKTIFYPLFFDFLTSIHFPPPINSMTPIYCQWLNLKMNFLYFLCVLDLLSNIWCFHYPLRLQIFQNAGFWDTTLSFYYPPSWILEKEIATHSSILAWKIPWTEEPGRLQSMGLQRVGNDWATWLYFHKPSTKRKQQKPNLAHSKTDGWMATDLAVMRKLKPQPAAGKDKKQPGCASEIQAWGCQVLFKVHVKTGWKTGESVKVKNGVSCSSCSPVLWPHGL